MEQELSGYQQSLEDSSINEKQNPGRQTAASLQDNRDEYLDSTEQTKIKHPKSSKRSNSQRSTSATLSALDSSRVDAEFLKSEGSLLPLNFGKNIPFFWIHGRPFFTIGPHWPLTVCLVTLIIVAAVSVSEYIAADISQFWYFGEYIIAGILIFFFLLTSLRNPGIAVERDDGIDSFRVGICSLCQIVLDETTNHCFDCCVCIRGYDHHCPWTGKCIGRDNLLWFKFFVASFVVFFAYSFTTCVVFSL